MDPSDLETGRWYRYEATFRDGEVVDETLEPFPDED